MIPSNIPIQHTVPISGAITYPEDELVDFNGFAWTQSNGIVVKSISSSNQTLNNGL